MPLSASWSAPIVPVITAAMGVGAGSAVVVVELVVFVDVVVSAGTGSIWTVPGEIVPILLL